MNKQIISVVVTTFLLTSCGFFGGEQPAAPGGESIPPVSTLTPPSYVQVIADSVQAGSVESCKNLDDPEQQRQCEDQVLTTMAVKNNDKTACGQLDEAGKVKNCEETISAREYELAGEPDKCADITNDVLKGDCYNNAYYYQALNVKDARICEKITSEKQRELCTKAINP